jgi:hypothetical protein
MRYAKRTFQLASLNIPVAHPSPPAATLLPPTSLGQDNQHPVKFRRVVKRVVSGNGHRTRSPFRDVHIVDKADVVRNTSTNIRETTFRTFCLRQLLQAISCLLAIPERETIAWQRPSSPTNFGQRVVARAGWPENNSAVSPRLAALPP